MSDIVIGSLILGICSILAAGIHGCFQLRWKRKEKIMDAVIEMHKDAVGSRTDPMLKQANTGRLDEYVDLLQRFDDAF